MIPRPPRSTRTDTLFPYTTLFRSPDFLAAALLHARLAVMRKAWREAAKVVERSWPRTPSAELAALYGEVAPEAKPLEQVKRFGRLAALHPEHRASHLALAAANLAAGPWGSAEERRVGEEWVRTCRSRWCPEQLK